MVMVVNVLFVLIGVLLFSPIPPIQPFLPRPLQLHSTAIEQRKVVHQASPQTTLQDEPPPPTLVRQSPDQPSAQLDGAAHTQLYRRVAARSLGEGAFALAEIACTIKNRLRVSRAPLTSVLRAYRAADLPPKPAHIEIVRQVFEGELPCPATWWYALSLQDTRYWRPHQRSPVKTIRQNDRKQILIFER